MDNVVPWLVEIRMAAPVVEQRRAKPNGVFRVWTLLLSECSDGLHL